MVTVVAMRAVLFWIMWTCGTTALNTTESVARTCVPRKSDYCSGVKTEYEVHNHPNPGPPQRDKYFCVVGYLLEPGDVLEATDLYTSSNGYWEPCPCPGLTIQGFPNGGGPLWVRPKG